MCPAMAVSSFGQRIYGSGGGCAGSAEFSADGRGEQGGVGADGKERPALREAGGGGGPVGDEHPAGLPVAPRRGEDSVQGLNVGGCGDVAGHAEVVAEVAGTDEQHVDPIDGGDVVGGGDRG